MPKSSRTCALLWLSLISEGIPSEPGLLTLLRIGMEKWARGMQPSTRTYGTRDAAGTRMDCAWELVNHRAVTEAGRDTSARSRVNMAPWLKLLPGGLCASGRKSCSVCRKTGRH